MIHTAQENELIKGLLGEWPSPCKG
jgi:hypothetical protein